MAPLARDFRAGPRSTIGGRPITVGDVALLEDGTIAGSILTMDRAFAKLVSAMGLSLVDAATVCATTPARALNLQGLGVIAPGATADLVVLDRDLNVVHTFLGRRAGLVAAGGQPSLKWRILARSDRDSASKSAFFPRSGERRTRPHRLLPV